MSVEQRNIAHFDFMISIVPQVSVYILIILGVRACSLRIYDHVLMLTIVPWQL